MGLYSAVFVCVYVHALHKTYSVCVCFVGGRSSL